MQCRPFCKNVQKLKRPAIIFFILFACVTVQAQEPVYIPPASTVYVGDAQSVGVFGHFINEGNLSIPPNGRVYFLGKIFKNSNTALLTD
ncbi:MAG TPA: hypothetical protein VF145_04135, partial [Chitinophagaceae bacterium]